MLGYVSQRSGTSAQWGARHEHCADSQLLDVGSRATHQSILLSRTRQIVELRGVKV